MLRGFGIRPLVILAVVLGGCAKSDVANQKPGASSNHDATPAVAGVDPNNSVDPNKVVARTDTPEAAAREFLEALRSGNDGKAAELLSSVAREKMVSVNRGIRPPASDTARFTVNKVKYLNSDGAQVSCTWTDSDEEGQVKSDEAIWVLRCEPGGWRVAGVAARVFPGEPPLLLNFEDPKDMDEKTQWLREEICRRAESQQEEPAQTSENPEKPVRR